MISDEERREVAARMREIMRENPHGWLDVMVAQSVLDVMGEGMAIGETVADLIDRPTCQMVECTIDHGSRSWGMRCTACGEKFEHMKPSYGWRNCPNCGAEVVDK
jgi:hypothetical protein